MNAAPAPPNLHASAIAFGPQAGVLITGPSGSGKSTLALSLIDQGAQLVADDQTLIARVDAALFARAPQPIAGLIEVRGFGLIRLPPRRLARIRLVIDLTHTEDTRLPPLRTHTIAGVTLPLLHPGPTPLLPIAIRHYIMKLEQEQ
ncbi:MAG: HPr kinase/phosphatase C-terminal domain-containing protein [Pararhodobacter sp.]|nr:HPr kinase/phosphatase C-terminal domain-containing protein [Pararhodobacter sp.]